MPDDEEASPADDDAEDELELSSVPRLPSVASLDEDDEEDELESAALDELPVLDDDEEVEEPDPSVEVANFVSEVSSDTSVAADDVNSCWGLVPIPCPSLDT